MATASKNKLRTFYLLDILRRETDDSHVMSSVQIMDALKALDITVDRKSIYADIELLQTYGYDINLSYSPKGYYLGEREFEHPELRLIADAIQAANFISKKKTDKLLEKLEKFSSKYDTRTLSNQVYVDMGTKTSNEEIYYTISKIDEAIKNNKQISFTYHQRKKTDNFNPKTESKEFSVINPYSMIWSNDHYYLVANNPKYDNLMHLRIDKMKKVEILKGEIRPISEVSEYKTKLHPLDYATKHINMFSGEIQTIELICNYRILDTILDKFGEKIKLISVDNDRFQISINMAISDGLVSWIMQYGTDIFVKSPKVLSKKVVIRSKEIYEMYQPK